MTNPRQEAPVNDNDTVMRRVSRTEVTLHEDDGIIRPSSDAFLQGGPDGDVSVYLASETTPERITRNYPGMYVALVEVSVIRALGLEVEMDQTEEDSGHCNITGRKTRSRARAIARSSRWAEGFGPV